MPIDSAVTVPSEAAGPVMLTVSPGCIALTVVLTDFVTLVAGEVATLTVLPSRLVTYSVLPARYATCPEVGRVKPPPAPPAFELLAARAAVTWGIVRWYP